MAYNQQLASRMRSILLTRPGIIEKNMFGGIGFLLRGNMCCGIWKDLLVVRLSPEESAKALKQKHVRPMDITGRPMKGWLFVEPEGYEDDCALLGWVERSVEHAGTMPAKKK